MGSVQENPKADWMTELGWEADPNQTNLGRERAH